MTCPAAKTGAMLSAQTVCPPGPMMVELPFPRIPKDQILGVRERRYPCPINQPGVPAHMVGVQVGVDDNVNIFGCDAGLGEAFQERGLQL